MGGSEEVRESVASSPVGQKLVHFKQFDVSRVVEITYLYMHSLDNLPCDAFPKERIWLIKNSVPYKPTKGLFDQMSNRNEKSLLTKMALATDLTRDMFMTRL